MVARDEHAIILIRPCELRLQPRVVRDHQQCAQSGLALAHVIPTFVTRASPPTAPRASASGSQRVKLLPLPGSLATSIAPPIACAICSASNAPSPNPESFVDTKGLNSPSRMNARVMPQP